MLNLIKILLVGAEVFYADGQTYDKASSYCWQLCEIA